MKRIDGFLAQLALFLKPGQIAVDPGTRTYYAQDWSKSLTPDASAILFPESTLEVSKILSLARSHGIPVVPSGGRTGLSGGAVAAKGEVVVSLIRMNHMGPVHEGALTVKVEAGAITEAVHRHCAPHGLTWPVDFASKGSSTVGGNIATNAGGVRVIRYGNTRNWVLGITAVAMDGTVHEFNSELEKNNTGYDLRQLLTGSEGTLAVITEATLKVCPLPKSKTAVLFALENFPKLLALFATARKEFPTLSAFECLDSACMESVTGHFAMPFPFPSRAGVYALLELENTSFDEVESPLARILEEGLAQDAVLAQTDKEAAALWKYREGVAESILHGHEVHQEDVSVPVSKLEEFYAEIESRYERELPGFKVFFFGHIGDGNLHIFIQKPQGLSNEEFVQRAHTSDHELFKILQRMKGSVSAEHGIGLLKKHAIGFSRTGPELALMRGLKSVFDPENLLNPGKLLP